MNNLFRARPAVAGLLTPEFLAGGDLPPIDAHVETMAEQVDLDLVREVFALGLEQYPEHDDESHNQLDAWLAPRIHYTVRLPRRTASDSGVWTWLSLIVGRKYVHHRWFDRDEGLVRKWRYMHEDLLRNAISRLWWGAEQGRNGPSYELVPVIFGQVRRAQFALELKYSWYRPAVIAFARVVADVEHAGSNALNDELTKELSKRFNAYLSLRALEAFGLSHGPDDDSCDEEWRRHRPSLNDVRRDVRTLEGPQDGFAPKEAAEEIEAWLVSLLAEIRLEKQSATPEAAAALAR